jgi:DNA-binding XRE family transcriptional regulator
MPRSSQFSTTPPYAVQNAIETLGANLRTARVRRNISIVDMANKLGVDRHVIADAERGKITTGLGVYVGMLWAMDLLRNFSDIADPKLDLEGVALAMSEERERSYPSRGMSNDF